MQTKQVTVQTPFGPITQTVKVDDSGEISVQPILDSNAQILATLNKVSSQLADLNSLVIKLLLK